MHGDLLSQTLFGQYRLEAFAASTPLGELYRACDLRSNHQRGLTLLFPSAVAGPEAFNQLNLRAAALKKLHHPRLLPCYGLAQDEKNTGLLEAWVDGPSLRDILLAHPGETFTVTETLTYAKTISAALDFLHSQGYVHTGLCPERVHIDRDGNIQLSGVGGSKRNGEIDFQPADHPYAAPEQTHPARLSPATDVYALAAILFELLTGQPPIDELTNPRKLNPEIPDFLARLILQGLARIPMDRFASAGEFFLTLCMAAGLQAESIAERAAPNQTPVTAEVISLWHYLPPPADGVSNPIPLRPLEKVLTASGAPPRKKIDFTRFIRPALFLFLLIGGGYALWRVQPQSPASPAPAPRATSLNSVNANAILPSPVSTLTLPPLPTETHGGNIVFTCSRGDFNQICMIRADGQNLQLLTNTSFSHNYYPAFAPGGQMIVFASNRNGSFDLYLLILQSGQLSQLTNQIGNVISPSFSPDGQKIVFVNRAAEGPTSLWVVDKDGVNPKLLYTGTNTIVAAAWSPDGTTIAYAMSIDQPNEYQIFLMDADGRNHRRLSQGLLGIGGSLSWSPDSRYLLIFAGPPGDKDIYRLDAATGDYLRLTSGGNNTASSYSPDGTQIVFNSLRNNDQADLFIMNADGSGLRQLTDHPEPDWQPRWEK